MVFETNRDEIDKHSSNKLEFEVRDLFMFGSPVPLILAFRKINGELKRKSDTDSGKLYFFTFQVCGEYKNSSEQLTWDRI